MTPFNSALPLRTLAVVAIGFVAGAAAAQTTRLRAELARYVTASVRRGDIMVVVRAPGNLRAVNSVPIRAAISGTVKEVFAEFNSRVRAGQVLAQLDRSAHEDRINEAESDLARAEASAKGLQATVPSLEAAVETSQANVARLQAAAENARTGAARVAGLFQQGILTQEQHDQAQASLHQAEAHVHAAEAGLQKSKAELELVRARLQNFRAQVDTLRKKLEEAETVLAQTTIYSPMDGVVVARHAATGQAIDVSGHSPALFEIAPDLRLMQIIALTDESDTAQIRVGSKVTIQADHVPKEIWAGHVKAIRPSDPEGWSGATYETLIEFENSGERLLPGDTVYVTIPTAYAANTLKVPAAALRFAPELPSREVARLYAQHKIPLTETGTVAEGWRVVWRLGARRRIEPVAIRVGISDHNHFQLLEGNLKEGDTLASGRWSAPRVRSSTAAGASGQKANPTPR